MTRWAAGAVALACMAALGGADASLAAGPKVYVGLFKDDAVAVVTPDGRKVYVSSDGASTVSVIDTASDKVVATIEVGANPHGLAISQDGRRLLVSAFGTNRSLVIDTATDRMVGEVAVPQVHNGTLSADGGRAYVASQKQGEASIVFLDLKTMTRMGAVPLDKTPRALDLSPDGKRLYFTLAGINAVQVLDTATNQVVGQIPVGASPHEAPFSSGRVSRIAVRKERDSSTIATTRTATGTQCQEWMGSGWPSLWMPS